MMKKIKFADLVENEFEVRPNRYVVETEDGTVLKVDEELSIGSVVNFHVSQVVSMGNPNNIEENHYQGFVKECLPIKLEWDATTDVEDVYIAMKGNPIPVALLAYLTSQVLKS